MLRAAMIGVAVALALVVVVAGLAIAGVIEVPVGQQVAERVLIVATAPDENGVQLAAVAFVLERGGAEAVLMDVDTSVTVSGTSATSARTAFPFGGGSTVAAALRPQTSSQALPWISLPPVVWSRLIDSAGGIEIDVPDGVSSYSDGQLTIVDSGKRQLTGEQAVALASACVYLGPTEKAQATRALESALSSLIVARSGQGVSSAVAAGDADSSMPQNEVRAFFTAQ